MASRSRKKRSWLMITAQPAKFSSASSSARSVLDVEVVGRLVEQEHVAALLEHLRQMDAVALAARQLADLLLLVRPLEVEGADMGARADLVLAEAEDVEAVGNLLPDILVGAEMVARLVDITEMDGRPDDDLAAVRLLLTGDQPKQSGLAGAVGPITPTMPPGGRLNVRSSNSNLS